MPTALSATRAPRTFVAREPIFDRERRVFGYRLLVRATNADELVDALAVTSLEALVGDRLAFVTVPDDVLVSDGLVRLPKDHLVLHVPGAAAARVDVVARCRELVTRGFAIAIDGAAITGDADPVAALARYIEIDFRAVTTAEARRGIAAVRQPGAYLLATGVDTPAEFSTAVAEGFTYLAGSFLAHPILTPGKPVDVGALGRMRVLHALHNPMLSVAQIEELIKPDAAICFQVLRTVNSAAFAQRRTIQSIHDALLLLGRDMIRRWISVWTVAGLARQVHPELMTTSAVRARCCELLGDAAAGQALGSEAFLAGLCSSLDAILGIPMEEVVRAVPLSEESKAALLGGDNRLRALIDCVKAYERGDWAQSIDLAARLQVGASDLPAAYQAALKWARELQRG